MTEVNCKPVPKGFNSRNVSLASVIDQIDSKVLDKPGIITTEMNWRVATQRALSAFTYIALVTWRIR